VSDSNSHTTFVRARAPFRASANINHIVPDPVWIVDFEGPCGTADGMHFLNRQEAVEYNADPDLFAAKHLGFATADEYREWVETQGYALCSERTKSGRLCRNLIGGGQLDPAEWRARHRSAPCFNHGGQS
jgi:hypothetical protein